MTTESQFDPGATGYEGTRDTKGQFDYLWQFVSYHGMNGLCECPTMAKCEGQGIYTCCRQIAGRLGLHPSGWDEEQKGTRSDDEPYPKGWSNPSRNHETIVVGRVASDGEIQVLDKAHVVNPDSPVRQQAFQDWLHRTLDDLVEDIANSDKAKIFGHEHAQSIAVDTVIMLEELNLLATDDGDESRRTVVDDAVVGAVMALAAKWEREAVEPAQAPGDSDGSPQAQIRAAREETRIETRRSVMAACAAEVRQLVELLT